MKENKILLVGVVIAIVLSVLSFINSGNKEITVQAHMNESDRNSITVSGEAEKMVKPDTASVSFTMTKKSNTMSQATDSVNMRMKKMLDDLKDQGIEEKDIKTTNYSVRPEYNWNNGNRKFTGYRVSQSVLIKIRDLDQVEKVMSKIAMMQVDNVSGLNFFVDNDDEIKEELRSEAIKKAQEKAKKLANELGVSLDTIIAFNEGSNRSYPVYRNDYAEMKLMSAEAVPSASIPMGENEMKSFVTITYRIK